MLNEAGLRPTIINGGGMLNFNRDNAVIGNGDIVVVETDESDGTITHFHADIAVLTNISEDHKDLEELMNIFRQFLSQARVQILNMDCPNVVRLACDFPDAIQYRTEDASHLQLIVPGKHNQSNAAAALSVSKVLDIDKDKAVQSLSEFKGITSRLEVIGRKNGITIIDDFGHNPDKIEAGLKVLKEDGAGRLILVYQPHGFKPLRQHKDQLIEIFAKYLTPNDIFYMPEILYFGGTVDKDISSKGLTDALRARGLNASYMPLKDDIKIDIINQAKEGDTICIMGARDNTLREMAQAIYKEI
jgi:UDP-N-acetylmuramate--alanine ligase